jgi:hypothetical protein
MFDTNPKGTTQMKIALANGYMIERRESYCGRCTPIVEWALYMPDGKLWGIFSRKKDALAFSTATL